MKLAFCLFKYFPYGGLQRDFLRIASECVRRGHEVHVYTQQWEGEVDERFHIHTINTQGWQNHARNLSFVDAIQVELAKHAHDLVIGFNKIPNLDIYYAADVCYQARVHEQRGFLYRLLPRYKQLIAFERSVFAKGKRTQILMIAKLQQQEFMRYYQTEASRFHLLPPGIAKDRMAPANAHKIRAALRESFHIPSDDTLLLMVGSGFKTKGLDRAIRGLAALPEAQQSRCHLFVIGQDNPKSFQKLAKQLHVADKIQFLGGRPDVPDFLLAADLLLHPAYHENTGTVLLEALVAGLPVLTVENCGYAHYITDADAGEVLALPFAQAEFNLRLQTMIASPHKAKWQQNALTFAKCADIYSLPEKAVDLIEYVGQQREFVSA